MERIHVQLTKAEAKELKRITTDTILMTPPCKSRKLLEGIRGRLEEATNE